MENKEIVESRNEKQRPFSEIIKLWVKIREMNESFFRNELPHTSITNTFISIVIIACYTTIIAILGYIINNNNSGLTSNYETLNYATSTRIIFLLCGIFITPISFYVNNGITFISANILGGKGKYSSQAYLHSLFYVPLCLISGLAGLFSAIPTIGNCIVILVGLVIIIFDLLLRVKVFKTVHEFTTGKAIIAILSPIILLLLFPLCFIILLAIMSSTIDNAFTNIINAI